MSANSPIPLGKFAWLILVAVVAAPTAFFLLVTPKEPDEPAAPPAEKRPLSKLESVGLRDYRDWDGLPEMFAVWADKLTWVKDKTWFAYWNPGTRSYSYFFEVSRKDGSYHFREISRTLFSERIGGIFVDEADGAIDEIFPDASERTPEHPFLFNPHRAFVYDDDPPLDPTPLLRRSVEPRSNDMRKISIDVSEPKKP